MLALTSPQSAGASLPIGARDAVSAAIPDVNAFFDAFRARTLAPLVSFSESLASQLETVNAQLSDDSISSDLRRSLEARQSAIQTQQSQIAQQIRQVQKKSVSEQKAFVKSLEQAAASPTGAGLESAVKKLRNFYKNEIEETAKPVIQLQAARQELRRQLDQIEAQRASVIGQQSIVAGPALQRRELDRRRSALEPQVSTRQAQIAPLEQQLAEARTDPTFFDRQPDFDMRGTDALINRLKNEIEQINKEKSLLDSKIKAIGQDLPKFIEDLILEMLPGTAREDMPSLLTDPVRLQRAGGSAAFDPRANQILIAPEMMAGLQQGNLTREQQLVIREEVFHAIQTHLGSAQGIESIETQRRGVMPVATIGASDLREVAVEVSQYSESVRMIEAEAKIAARQSLAASEDVAAAQAAQSALFQKVGFAGGTISKFLDRFNQQFGEVEDQMASQGIDPAGSSKAAKAFSELRGFVDSFKDPIDQTLDSLAAAATGEMSASELDALSAEADQRANALKDLWKNLNQVKAILKMPEVQEASESPAPDMTALATVEPAQTQLATVGDAVSAAGGALAPAAEMATAGIVKVAQGAYKLAEIVESLALDLIPAGRTIKAGTQFAAKNVAAPAGAFLAAGQIPGIAQLEGLVTGAMTSIAESVAGAGTAQVGAAVQAALHAAIPGFIPGSEAIVSTLSGEITGLVGGIMSATGVASAEALTAVLGGATLINLLKKALHAGVDQAAKALPAAQESMSQLAPVQAVAQLELPFNLPSKERVMEMAETAGELTGHAYNMAMDTYENIKDAAAETLDQVQAFAQTDEGKQMAFAAGVAANHAVSGVAQITENAIETLELITAKLPGGQKLIDLTKKQLEGVQQQLNEKLAKVRSAESQGQPVLGGSAAVERDLKTVNQVLESRSLPPDAIPISKTDYEADLKRIIKAESAKIESLRKQLLDSLRMGDFDAARMVADQIKDVSQGAIDKASAFRDNPSLELETGIRQSINGYLSRFKDLISQADTATQRMESGEDLDLLLAIDTDAIAQRFTGLINRLFEVQGDSLYDSLSQAAASPRGQDLAVNTAGFAASALASDQGAIAAIAADLSAALAARLSLSTGGTEDLLGSDLFGDLTGFVTGNLTNLATGIPGSGAVAAGAIVPQLKSLRDRIAKRLGQVETELDEGLLLAKTSGGFGDQDIKDAEYLAWALEEIESRLTAARRAAEIPSPKIVPEIDIETPFDQAERMINERELKARVVGDFDATLLEQEFDKINVEDFLAQWERIGGKKIDLAPEFSNEKLKQLTDLYTKELENLDTEGKSTFDAIGRYAKNFTEFFEKNKIAPPDYQDFEQMRVLLQYLFEDIEAINQIELRGMVQGDDLKRLQALREEGLAMIPVMEQAMKVSDLTQFMSRPVRQQDDSTKTALDEIQRIREAREQMQAAGPLIPDEDPPLRLIDFIGGLKDEIIQLGRRIPILGQLSTAIKGMGALLIGAGIVAGIQQIAQGFVQLAHSIKEFSGYEAARNLEVVTTIVKFAVSDVDNMAGAWERADQAMQMVSRTSRQMGLDLVAAREGYKLLATQLRGTGVSTDDLFEGFSAAATTLEFNADQFSRGILAISQIAGKGRVQSQELRQQLGELGIPFALAARSMEMSIGEFNKALERGEVAAVDFLPRYAQTLRDEFGPGVADAAQATITFENRLRNASLELREAFGQRTMPVVLEGMKLLEGGLRTLADNADTLIKLVNLGLTVALSALLPLLAKVGAAASASAASFLAYNGGIQAISANIGRVLIPQMLKLGAVAVLAQGAMSAISATGAALNAGREYRKMANEAIKEINRIQTEIDKLANTEINVKVGIEDEFTDAFMALLRLDVGGAAEGLQRASQRLSGADPDDRFGASSNQIFGQDMGRILGVEVGTAIRKWLGPVSLGVNLLNPTTTAGQIGNQRQAMEAARVAQRAQPLVEQASPLLFKINANQILSGEEQKKANELTAALRTARDTLQSLGDEAGAKALTRIIDGLNGAGSAAENFAAKLNEIADAIRDVEMAGLERQLRVAVDRARGNLTDVDAEDITAANEGRDREKVVKLQQERVRVIEQEIASVDFSRREPAEQEQKRNELLEAQRELLQSQIALEEGLTNERMRGFDVRKRDFDLQVQQERRTQSIQDAFTDLNRSSARASLTQSFAVGGIDEDQFDQFKFERDRANALEDYASAQSRVNNLTARYTALAKLAARINPVDTQQMEAAQEDLASLTVELLQAQTESVNLVEQIAQLDIDWNLKKTEAELEAVNEELQRQNQFLDEAAGAQTRASNAAIQQQENLQAQLDTTNRALERQRNLFERTTDLIRAQARITTVNLEGRAGQTGEAMSVRQRLDEISAREQDTENPLGAKEASQLMRERFELRAQLRRLTGSVFASELDILKKQQRIEDEIARDKFEALRREEEISERLLEIDLKNQEIAARRLLIETQIAKLRAQQGVIDAESGVREAESGLRFAQEGGDEFEIRQASEALRNALASREIAQAQVPLSEMAIRDAEAALSDFTEIVQLSRQALALNQSADRREFQLGEQSRERGQSRDLLRAGGSARGNRAAISRREFEEGDRRRPEIESGLRRSAQTPNVGTDGTRDMQIGNSLMGVSERLMALIDATLTSADRNVDATRIVGGAIVEAINNKPVYQEATPAVVSRRSARV